MDQELLEVRKRLHTDFGYYAKHALKIRTKEGEIKPLVLNEAQKKLNDAITNQYDSEGRVRVIILKARQMGLSTVVGGWLYYWLSQHNAQKGLVITHHSDSTKALFDMTKRFHDQCPELLKPQTSYSSPHGLGDQVGHQPDGHHQSATERTDLILG